MAIGLVNCCVYGWTGRNNRDVSLRPRALVLRWLRSHFKIRDKKKISVKNMKGGKEKWGQKEDPRLILTKIFYFSAAILMILLYPHIFNLIFSYLSVSVLGQHRSQIFY